MGGTGDLMVTKASAPEVASVRAIMVVPPSARSPSGAKWLSLSIDPGQLRPPSATFPDCMRTGAWDCPRSNLPSGRGDRLVDRTDVRSCVYGLPTKVVTLWASSEALKRALLTVMGLLEARLSAADVTQGVMLQGTTPET